MPSTCFDPSDLIIPMFDAHAKTHEMTVQFHPGQVRILDYLVDCDRFPFHQVADVVRCCVCLGIEALLSPFPTPYALIEARMNILNDERFERQKDAGALAFVDNFEAAIEEIDEWFGVSGLVRNEKLRTLTRKIVFEAKGDLRQRLKRALLTHYSSVGFLKWYVINVQHRRGSAQNGIRNG